MSLSIKDDCELCAGKKCAEEMISVNTIRGTDIPMKTTVCYECGSEYVTPEQAKWNKETYKEVINNFT